MARIPIAIPALVPLALSLSCASQLAQAPDKFCESNAECPSGRCERGRCVVLCNTGADCPSGYRCEGGTCVIATSDGGGAVGGDGGRADGGGVRYDGGPPFTIDGGYAFEDGGSSDGGPVSSDGGPAAGDGGPTPSDGGTRPTDGGRAESCQTRGSTRSCGPNRGICRPGTQTCSGEFWGPCLGAVSPEPELCDGRDHDCDGIPNNPPLGCDCQNGDTRPCYEGPPGTEGVGTCRAGAQVCSQGQWGTCQGAVQPQPGNCNVASCTGGPNPGCDCILGSTRSCYTGSNQQEVGRGVCRAGTQACIVSGTTAVWGTCTGERLPETEQCDNLDHDCDGIPNNPAGGCNCTDGQTRNCYGGPPGTENVGTCHAGMQTCAGGIWGSCLGAVEPEPGNCAVPSCAGTPNPGCECVLGTTRDCYSGNPLEVNVGICRAGRQLCISNAPGTSTWGPCQNQRLPEPEQCDGLDHNCDGTPNNRATGCDCTNGDTRSCYNGPAGTEGVGTCRAGTQTCADGRWGTCEGAVEPQAGNCAVLSCTGGLNPGCACLVGSTQSCYDGPAQTRNVGTCRDGNQSCVAVTGGSSWGSCQDQRLPELEVCDTLDHDCNGIPGDRIGGCVCTLGDSQSCYTGPAGTLNVGTCHAGSQQCELVSGSYQWGACTGEVKPATCTTANASTCCSSASCTGPDDPNPGCICINGRTRSCYTGPTGTENVGICHGGTQTCVGGQWGSCTGQVTPSSSPDLCVPQGAAYDPTKDLNCNNQLERHAPVGNPSMTTQLGTGRACSGAGCSSYFRSLTVSPLDTVLFTGAATDQETTVGMTYEWRILSAPTGSTAVLSGATGYGPNDISRQQNPTLFAQLAGDYVIGFTPIDGSGCRGTELQLLVRVEPDRALHLQLTWNAPVDVDLQLARPSTAVFSTTNDGNRCYWGAKTPSWGATLDIDDLAGCNPENINYNPSATSDYVVYVHYYCNRRGHYRYSDYTGVCYETASSTGTVRATVRIYINAVLRNTLQMDLAAGQYWKVATLQYTVGSGGTTSWTVTPTTATGSQVQSDCTGSSTCTCSAISNPNDPYCRNNGIGCY